MWTGALVGRRGNQLVYAHLDLPNGRTAQLRFMPPADKWTLQALYKGAKVRAMTQPEIDAYLEERLRMQQLSRKEA